MENGRKFVESTHPLGEGERDEVLEQERQVQNAKDLDDQEGLIQSVSVILNCVIESIALVQEIVDLSQVSRVNQNCFYLTHLFQYWSLV